ncbi:unnamed protein product [Prunus armeniaca]|uniref:Uncharacterized protein n=1 Tax=Prunus armeniaca TaxID=36596 RepID=A0A6J5UZT4_PRUAR|nr:unnamed protein product [Prunus armeniaca]
MKWRPDPNRMDYDGRELYYIEIGLRAIVNKEEGTLGEDERVAGSQPSNLERVRDGSGHNETIGPVTVRPKCNIGLSHNRASISDLLKREGEHVAASKGYEDITRFLIDQGADVELSDKFGNTPLLEAIKNGHDQVASNVGASLTIDDAGDFLCNTVSRRNLDMLKRLLADDINPNVKNYDKRHLAASEGLYSMAKFLLEAGASVLSKDRWGRTPLDEARIGGNKKLIKLLEVARTSQFSDEYH